MEPARRRLPCPEQRDDPADDENADDALSGDAAIDPHSRHTLTAAPAPVPLIRPAHSGGIATRQADDGRPASDGFAIDRRLPQFLAVNYSAFTD